MPLSISFGEDMFAELFPEYKSLNSVTEKSGNSLNTYTENEDISNSHRFESSVNSCANINGHSDYEESQKSEKLKLLELKGKIIDQESQIAEYEGKLSKNMEDLMTTKTSMDNAKKNCEVLEKENLSLKEELNHFKARILQLEELQLQKKEEEKEITNLQKDLSVKEKQQRKLKNELGSYAQKLEETNNHLQKIKSSNKRLWTLVAELGKTLSKAGLLTPKQKKILSQEHAENISASDIKFEGEFSKNISSFINEIDMTSEDKNCRNSETKKVLPTSGVHSTSNPPLPSYDFPENNTSSNHSKFATEDINSESGKTKDVSTSVFNLKSGIASKQLSTLSATPTPTPSNIVNPSAKVKSFGSNYFLKTCKNVLDDPDVIDWQVDNTFKELQDLRQQLPVYKEHFAPISPLPRTPSPNNLKFKMQPNNKKLLKPPGKRLNFCHQQSESFDVHEIQPPVISNSLARNHVNNVFESSHSPSNHYALSTKRNHDGSLKFNFSANVNSHLSLDLNTLQVSCVVAPHSTSSIDFTDSNQIGILSPLSSHLVQTTQIHSQEQFRCPTLQSRNESQTTNEVFNRTQTGSISNVNNKQRIPSEISVCELENNTSLNVVETEKCKKVKLDSEENHTVIQGNNLPTSIKRNIPTKNHSLFPELQNVPLNFVPIMPVPILNSSLSPGPKKIKRSKSIGKVNSKKNSRKKEKNQILSNEMFKTPSKSDSLSITSSSTEEKSPQMGCGKSKKKVKHGLKKCKTAILSQMAISNDDCSHLEKSKSKNDHGMHSENAYQNCEIDNKSDNSVSIDTNIQRNEKILNIMGIPAEMKCTISSNESLLLEDVKSKNLSPDKNLSKVENSIHSNFQNSNLEKGNLLSDIQEICPTSYTNSLSAAPKRENVEMLTASSLVKNAVLEKVENMKISTGSEKNDTDCYDESVCHETVQDKNSNILAEVSENELLSNEIEHNSILNITFNRLFTPKGLFANHSFSNDAPSTSTSIKENASTANETVNISKLSSTLPPGTTLTKSIVSFNKNLKELCSGDLNKCMNSHNGFLSVVNEASHDEKPNETNSDYLPKPICNDNTNGEINHTDRFLTTVNSVTEENTFKAPLEVSHIDEVDDNRINSNKSIDYADSEVMDSDDFNSDHKLVIAENEDNLDSGVVTSDNDMISESSSKSNTSRVSTKRKKLVSRKKQNVKADETFSQISIPNKKASKPKKEINLMHVSIASAFNALDQMKFTDAHFNLTQHTLINALINPNNAANTKRVVYNVLKYLSLSKSNPFLNYHIRGDATSLFPLSEKCLVSVLLLINKKKKPHLQGLIDSTINTIYEFVLTKDKLSIHGLSSLCRVMTELCKQRSYEEKPLLLCCDLLKIHHKYAPYLIASIASVWKEIFNIQQTSVKGKIFLSSIAYGVMKKPATLTEQQWIHCGKILSSCISTPPFPNVKETIKSLMEMIEVTFKTGVLEDEDIFTTPLVTIAACEGWEWAKENIIDEYVIPFMVKFSEQEHNEKAFKLFCNLYVDICNFCPNIEEPNEVLSSFFETGNEGDGFVKTIVAMAQMKLILLRKLQLLPPHLTEWVNENQKNPEIAEFAHNLFQKRLMMDESNILESEVQ